MPNLQDFRGAMINWTIKVKAAGAMAVSAALDEGADYMREHIAEGSPTGTSWHEQKNAINGYPYGSRIGNANPGIGPVQDNPGTMFRSVQAEDAKVTNTKISGKFGWIKNREDYFAQQDAGTYGVGKNVGMGLINKGKKTVHNVGAKIVVEEKLRSSAKANGFSVSGTGA